MFQVTRAGRKAGGRAEAPPHSDQFPVGDLFMRSTTRMST